MGKLVHALRMVGFIHQSREGNATKAVAMRDGTIDGILGIKIVERLVGVEARRRRELREVQERAIAEQIREVEELARQQVEQALNSRLLGKVLPEVVVRLLQEGEADIGIATEAVAEVSELVSFPYYSWHHAVIAPPEHPLHQQPLTLDTLADYPLITYHQGFTGRARIDRTFADAGLNPDIVMAALDADVIKTYVELGMGVGIVSSLAIDPQRDQNLCVVDGEPLFGYQTARIAVRRGHYLRSYAYRFISLCSAVLDEASVRQALSPVLQE